MTRRRRSRRSRWWVICRVRGEKELEGKFRRKKSRAKIQLGQSTTGGLQVTTSFNNLSILHQSCTFHSIKITLRVTCRHRCCLCALALSEPSFVLSAAFSLQPSPATTVVLQPSLASPTLSPGLHLFKFDIQTQMDHSRDPCPWVALSDFGGAFCMGVRYAFYKFPGKLS